MDSNEQVAAALSQLSGVLESQLTILDSRLVDPMEKFMGPDGEIWDPITNSLAGNSVHRCPYRDESELRSVRDLGRWLAKENGFAQNGHENRISYVVGTGHVYTVTEKPRANISDDDRQAVQEIVDEFLLLNGWHWRQAETVLRQDRDGEVMLRKFPDAEQGLLRVRYVEPEAVFTPDTKRKEDGIEFGIRRDPDDYETRLEYWINGDPVDAAEIQHRKRGGDSSCLRGVPVFWSVRHNLNRASKILRNGSTVTELQTAIGLIRKLTNVTKATVQAWANTNANVKQTSNTAGVGTAGSDNILHQRFRPGTILTSGGNIEYEMPAIGIDPSKYIDSFQAEIRAVAARLIMSEAMFSSKTDDTSRAAAIVAEGPISKNFERLQAHEIGHDLELIGEALDLAVVAGRLTDDVRRAVGVSARGPSIIARDRLQEAQAREIDLRAGIVSPQTAAAESGREYEQEQSNIEDHQQRSGGVPSTDRPDDFLQ